MEYSTKKVLKTLKMHNKNTKKGVRYCNSKISIREEEGEFYSEGFIATTHIDRAQEDGCEGTALTREACQEIADLINEGKDAQGIVSTTRGVSFRHDWVKEGDADMPLAGIAMPPAEVRETGDGHFGVHVKTHHNKNHEKYTEIIDGVTHGYLPGYSIEFNEASSEKISIGGRMIKIIKSIKDFAGYAFADARMIANPSATIMKYGYREIESKIKEGNKMSEEEKKPEEPVKEPEAPKEEVPAEEVKEEPKEEPKEEEPVQEREVKINVKEVVSNLKDSPDFQKAVEDINVRSKILKTGKQGEQMNIKIKEMNKSLIDGDSLSFREAAVSFIDENDLVRKALNDPMSYTVGFKSNLKVRCEGKGLRIIGGMQVRGTLDTGSNASTYTQSPVEFADLFAPGIIDTFNNQTNLFGFLRKSQNPGGMFYQWKMIINKDPDSNPTFVDVDDTSVLKNFSDKNNYRTPIKIARRGISVTDFINKYSAASLGNLFQLEVDIQMKEMMNDVDAALFAEVADGTNNAPLGLEAVADSAGNGTLYGFTRSAANRLSPTTAADTYLAVGGNLTEAALRTKITNLRVQGSKDADIAIVGHPTSLDYLWNLMDGSRRFITTEAAFGFNKMRVSTFDGFPIISDHNCNVDAIYVIDQETDKIVMAMEPRLVSLAKVGAATEAYVEMHFAHVYEQPRRIGMLDTLSGP